MQAGSLISPHIESDHHPFRNPDSVGNEHALIFPGSDEPDFAEFLYLAFTVGMTAQVSDVTTCNATMRRLVLLHALVAFVFNAAVLAAAVNLAAGLAA